MDLTDILASLFGGSQGAPTLAAQVGDHNNPNTLQASLARFMPQQGTPQSAMPQAMPVQPQQPSIAPQAPQAQPQAQTAQASPAGGGVGGFLEDILMPKTAAKNRTAAYLQQQGMDAGTANLLVSDPQMLSTYLQQKMKGAGTTDFDQRAAAAKQYGLDPSTPEGRNFILTGKIPDAVQGNDDTAKQVAGAIISGDQPPDMKGLYKYSAPIRAELAKQGYNLTTAQEDWQATQRFIATSNGPQQLRMRQALESLPPQLDLIDELSKEWGAGGFKALNAANMTLALQGAYGPKANSIATRLSAAINDVTGEVGQVYMGGNSPTDHALDLAKSNLSANWSEGTLGDMTKQIRQVIAYRQNSLKNIGPAGIPAGTNPYDQSNPAAQPSQAAGSPQQVNPQAAAPQGTPSSGDAPPASFTGDAKLWKYMTPEQKKLWQ